MSHTIGIDLGTTNSCVAVLQNKEPIVLPNAEGSRTTPSIVAFTESGERLVGQQAKRQAIVNPERTVHGAKRLLGRKYRSPEVAELRKTLPFPVTESINGDAWVSIDGAPYSPQELSGMVLAKMKATAEDYLGEPVTSAVITVPAYFDDAQRQATKDAARIAGLEIKRIINEPTAAALAYGLNHKNRSRLAVFDLGGGTFDISILELHDGVFEVLSTAGNNALGGDDFDRVVLRHLIEDFEDRTGVDVSDDRMALQRLREAAEQAKCELSTLSETNINLPFLAVDDDGPKHLSRLLSRSELNGLVSHLVDRLEAPCRQALADAKLSSGDLDDVVLVGGMTRMPLVRERVESIFGRRPSKNVNPDEVVAVGAALQSAVMSGAVKDIVLMDVTPLSLGIRVQGNRMSAIIPRNAQLPASDTKIFTTTEDEQDVVAIAVLQGESTTASENRLLGTFHLSDIPPRPAGAPRIQVAFSIDSDGLVNVSATDHETGAEQSIVITDHGGLTEEEIRRASERAKMSAPRDPSEV